MWRMIRCRSGMSSGTPKSGSWMSMLWWMRADASCTAARSAGVPGRTDHSLQRQEGESLFCSGRAGGDRGAVGLGERLEDPRYGILPAAGGCSTDVAALLPGVRCRAGRYEKGLADGLDRDGLDSTRWAANRAINKRLWQVAHPLLWSLWTMGFRFRYCLCWIFPTYCRPSGSSRPRCGTGVSGSISTESKGCFRALPGR